MGECFVGSNIYVGHDMNNALRIHNETRFNLNLGLVYNIFEYVGSTLWIPKIVDFMCLNQV